VDPCARGEQRGPRETVPRECAGGNGGEVIPAINKNNLHDGKVRNDSDAHGRRGLAGDPGRGAELARRRVCDRAEQGKQCAGAKSAGYLYIHVTDKSRGQERGREGRKDWRGRPARAWIESRHQGADEVVDALFSAGKDELDIVAALKALSEARGYGIW